MRSAACAAPKPLSMLTTVKSRRATRERSVERGVATGAHAVADGRRHREHGARNESREHAEERAFHAGHGDDDAMAANFVDPLHESPQAGDTDVVDQRRAFALRRQAYARPRARPARPTSRRTRLRSAPSRAAWERHRGSPCARRRRSRGDSWPKRRDGRACARQGASAASVRRARSHARQSRRSAPPISVRTAPLRSCRYARRAASRGGIQTLAVARRNAAPRR